MPATVRQLLSRHRGATAIAVVVLIAVVVGVVATGHNSQPPPVSGTPAEAVATVEAFQRALSNRDFATICDRLFTPRARRAAGGDSCQSVLAQAAARLRMPAVYIRSVLVQRGGRAIVGVAAGVDDKPPVPDLIHLERRNGRFRIASVGNATPAGDD